MSPIRAPSFHLVSLVSLSLFRSLQKKVGPSTHLGRFCEQCCLHLPVVLLGLLPCLFADRHQRLHWQSCQLRSHERPRQPVPRFTPDSRSALQFLSNGVRVCHRRHLDGRHRRARSRSSRYGSYLFLDDPRLLPPRVLGLECERLGFQMGRLRLCWYVIIKVNPCARS